MTCPTRFSSSTGYSLQFNWVIGGSSRNIHKSGWNLAFLHKMGTEHDSKNNPSDNPVGADGNGGEDLVGDGGFTSSDDENGMESDSDSDFSSGAGSDPDSDDGEENVGGGGGTSKAAETRKEEDEVDEDDPVVKAIIQAKAKKSFNHPPDLVLEGIPSTLSFHPVEDRILFGNYDGQLLL